MRAGVYKGLWSLTNGKEQGIEVVSEAIEHGLSWSDVDLTIKNYSEFEGVSKAVHQDVKRQAAEFEIKGLLGKGL